MSNKVSVVGVIAEDNSDFEALCTLIRRIAGNEKVAFKKKIGNGCGRIRHKCLAWSNELKDAGCHMLIVVHDRDRNDLELLRKDLTDKLKASTFSNRIICIPVEELEAWFLSDPQCIKTVFNLQRPPKIHGSPEYINSPKEKIGELVRVISNDRRVYLNTSHNSRLAQVLSISEAVKKCPSFKELHEFVSAQSFK